MAAQHLVNELTLEWSAILWEMHIPIAIPPQLNEVICSDGARNKTKISRKYRDDTFPYYRKTSIRGNHQIDCHNLNNNLNC